MMMKITWIVIAALFAKTAVLAAPSGDKTDPSSYYDGHHSGGKPELQPGYEGQNHGSNYEPSNPYPDQGGYDHQKHSGSSFEGEGHSHGKYPSKSSPTSREPSFGEKPDVNSYPPYNAGGFYPYPNGGSYPYQNGGSYPHQNGGSSPYQNGGSYPHQNGGSSPYQNGGSYPHQNGGSSPYQNGGSYPHQNGGSYPPYAGGKNNPTDEFGPGSASWDGKKPPHGTISGGEGRYGHTPTGEPCLLPISGNHEISSPSHEKDSTYLGGKHSKCIPDSDYDESNLNGSGDHSGDGFKKDVKSKEKESHSN